jgi:hypothetical protein
LGRIDHILDLVSKRSFLAPQPALPSACVFLSEQATEEAGGLGGGDLGFSVFSVAPLGGGDGAFHLVDVLATASPGGLAADFAGNGTAHSDFLSVGCVVLNE